MMSATVVFDNDRGFITSPLHVCVCVLVRAKVTRGTDTRQETSAGTNAFNCRRLD